MKAFGLSSKLGHSELFDALLACEAGTKALGAELEKRIVNGRSGSVTDERFWNLQAKLRFGVV